MHSERKALKQRGRTQNNLPRNNQVRGACEERGGLTTNPSWCAAYKKKDRKKEGKTKKPSEKSFAKWATAGGRHLSSFVFALGRRSMAGTRPPSPCKPEINLNLIHLSGKARRCQETRQSNWRGLFFFQQNFIVGFT